MPRTPIQTVHPNRDRWRNDERAVPQLPAAVASLIPLDPEVDIADNDPEAESLGAGFSPTQPPQQTQQSAHTQADFTRADAGAGEADEELPDRLIIAHGVAVGRERGDHLFLMVWALALGVMIGFIAARFTLPADGAAPFSRTLAWGGLVLLVFIWPVLVGLAVQRGLRREFRPLARSASPSPARSAARAATTRMDAAPEPRHAADWQSRGGTRGPRKER